MAAPTFEVPPHPATAAERATFIAASIPWSRRGEKSTTRSPAPGSPPPADSTTRAALVAIIVWKLIWFRSRGSSSCASINGAVTRTSGSLEKPGLDGGEQAGIIGVGDGPAGRIAHLPERLCAAAAADDALRAVS